MIDAREPGRAASGHHLQASDVHGLVQLATHATLGVTDIVEGVHQAVWRTLGFAPGARTNRTRGITGFIYGCVRSTTELVGQTAGKLSANLGVAPSAAGSAQRLHMLSAVNGVIGDRLVALSSPLAMPMSFHQRGLEFDPNAASVNSKIVLLIHGLCLNDQHWHDASDSTAASDHGCAVGDACGHTPIYLRYNSGRHVSENGRELAHQLERLVDRWPSALEELSIIGHSMGGLVARSAVHYASVHQLRWPQILRKLICVGTPHHGSPLEQAGNWVDGALAKTSYSAPFARLGQLRSCGISDLRHGLLLDEQWRGRNRFALDTPPQPRVPLPRGADCYAIAATMAGERTALAEHLTGDGLVPLRSALGIHTNPQRDVGFETQRQWVTPATGHLALLHSIDVRNKLVDWLSAD